MRKKTLYTKFLLYVINLNILLTAQPAQVQEPNIIKICKDTKKELNLLIIELESCNAKGSNNSLGHFVDFTVTKAKILNCIQNYENMMDTQELKDEFKTLNNDDQGRVTQCCSKLKKIAEYFNMPEEDLMSL